MGDELTLGSRVRDRVTGFTGVVVQRCLYLGGGHQALVASTTLSEGKPVEHWFEDGRLESTEE